MRYVSANLFLFPSVSAKRRASEFAARINRLQIDVLCLQEIHTYGLLAHLMHELDPKLCHVKYHPGHLGPAGGLVIISRLPITGLQHVSLKTASNQLGRRVLWQNRALGAAHKGLLIAETGGVTFINYHGSPNHFETWESGYGAELVQTVQMGVLMSTVQDLKKAKRLCVCGDTNVDKVSCSLYEQLIGIGLCDPFGPDDTCSGRTRDYCCDWMLFYGSAYRAIVTQAQLLFVSERDSARRIWTTAISDHSPLLADVEWEAISV
jgi:hypothetical protein